MILTGRPNIIKFPFTIENAKELFFLVITLNTYERGFGVAKVFYEL